MRSTTNSVGYPDDRVLVEIAHLEPCGGPIGQAEQRGLDSRLVVGVGIEEKAHGFGSSGQTVRPPTPR